MHQEFLEIHFYSIVPTISAGRNVIHSHLVCHFLCSIIYVPFFSVFAFESREERFFKLPTNFFIQYFIRRILNNNKKYYHKMFIELKQKRSIRVVLFYWRFNKLNCFFFFHEYKAQGNKDNWKLVWMLVEKSLYLTLSLCRYVCDTIKLSNRISCDNHMAKLRNKQLVHIEIYI